VHISWYYNCNVYVHVKDGIACNYIYGIWAWHILHGVRWQMDTAELEVLLMAAEKTAPPASKKKKRVPYTTEFMLAV